MGSRLKALTHHSDCQSSADGPIWSWPIQHVQIGWKNPRRLEKITGGFDDGRSHSTHRTDSGHQARQAVRRPVIRLVCKLRAIHRLQKAKAKSVMACSIRHKLWSCLPLSFRPCIWQHIDTGVVWKASPEHIAGCKESQECTSLVTTLWKMWEEPMVEVSGIVQIEADVRGRFTLEDLQGRPGEMYLHRKSPT